MRFLVCDAMLLSLEDISTYSEAWCFGAALLNKTHPNDVRLSKSERDFVVTWNDGSKRMSKTFRPRKSLFTTKASA